MDHEAMAAALGQAIPFNVHVGLEVELADAEGNVVAEMTVHWYVKRNAA